jgi:ATP-dependent Clp protease protease subunit
VSDLITPGLVTPQNRSGQGGGTGLDEQVYNRLLRERIIFLGSVVEDANANLICAQLLLSSRTTSRPGPWDLPPRWGSSCSARARLASVMQHRTRG